MTTDRDLRIELEREDGTYPESWRPQPGDILVGTIEKYDRASTSYGTYNIAVLRDEQGALHSVWLMHAVLLDEFRKLRPRPGERLGIKRLEDAERGYRRYAVRVDREPGSDIPDFDAAPAADAPPATASEPKPPARANGGSTPAKAPLPEPRSAPSSGGWGFADGDEPPPPGDGECPF
jgi:hypothetical protein